MKGWFAKRPGRRDAPLAALSVPPFPHPLPERRLILHATKDGLLIIPRSVGFSSSFGSPSAGAGLGGTADVAVGREQGAKVRWGRSAKVEPLDSTELARLDLGMAAEAKTVVCFGVVGILRLFKESYLLVITSRKHAGDFLSPSCPVYRTNGVIAIPLSEERARKVLKEQAGKTKDLRSSVEGGKRPSLSTSLTGDEEEEEEEEEEGQEEDTDEEGHEDDVVTPAPIALEAFFDVKPPVTASPVADPTPAMAVPSSARLSPSPKANSPKRGFLRIGRLSGSQTSSKSSSQDVSPTAASTAAAIIGRSGDVPSKGKVSFAEHARSYSSSTYSKLDKEPDHLPVTAEALTASFEPSSAVSAPAATADDPSNEPDPLNTRTAEERYRDAQREELEEKVVMATVRMFGRGEMWFSYDFDLTHSLQRKHQAIAQSKSRSSSARPSPPTSPTTTQASSLPPRPKSEPQAQAQPSTAFAAAGSTSRTSDRPGDSMLFEEPQAALPLWRRVDRRFWQNEHLTRDFVDAGLHSLVLPLMQGYFQSSRLPIEVSPSSTSIPPPTVSGTTKEPAGEPLDEVSPSNAGIASSARTESDVLTLAPDGPSHPDPASDDTDEKNDSVEAQLIIVSRRSKERAGLRYQRRGVNDAGQVANYVETEQILCIRRGDDTHVLSFVQFRGSIPLYWSQSPFSLKPPPVLERSPEENLTACDRHFETQTKLYGPVYVVNLAEQQGKEQSITEAYRDRVAEMGRENVKYIAFDFHRECAGMKFENVSRLIQNVNEDINSMGFFWRSSEGQVYCEQKGAFRVSCLDCLDRTNVVQSAFARHVLNVQLERIGIVLSTTGAKNDAFEFVFNDTWANNGDLISQAYAGTRALKGDWTRTGKRNLIGMMNDATNSVFRMVQGAVTDFFKQAVIDFYLAATNLSALERYGDTLMSADPDEAGRLTKIRAAAIESCAREVIFEEEKKIAGWTLLSPIEPGKIQSSNFEEKVVLLTKKALYVCGYDFTVEKVSEFSRIRLGDIVAIQKGVYIVATSEAFHPEDNWGFLITFLKDEQRINTSSMKNVPPSSPSSESKFLAFRVVRNDFMGASSRSELEQGSRLDDEGHTSHEVVEEIVRLIVAEATNVGACDAEGGDNLVKEAPIQTLAEAKRHASLFEPLLAGIKRSLWL